MLICPYAANQQPYKLFSVVVLKYAHLHVHFFREAIIPPNEFFVYRKPGSSDRAIHLDNAIVINMLRFCRAFEYV